ncbi:MAG: LamG-like jellyroll fold domain-containing protein, partial [Verrucomicrobiota bacterium]
GGSDSVTSAPVVLKVNPASLPLLSQNTTPSAPSNIFIGTSLAFSASFIGSQPITYQWQISTDDGAAFQNLSGDTNSTLLLTNLQAINSGEYRLEASNSLGSSNSTPATLTVLAGRPPLQVAGQMLVNLQASDLNSGVNVWTNEINGVGNFSTIGGGDLNVATLTFDSQSVKSLAVGLETTNAVVSVSQVPVGLTANGPVSVEAWVYPTNDVNANNSGNNTAASYGVQGGSGDPMAQREFNFNTGGNGALSGDFGDLDTGWNGTLTLNTWHYLVYTYDGTTFRLYMDGVENKSETPGSLNTVQTAMFVGAAIAGTDPTGADGFGDPFGGYIAAVRVEAGTLSTNQVANNFLAGPLQTISIVVSPATVSPSNIVFLGDAVTLSVADVQSLQTLTYQWQTDNGSDGATWTDISGATSTNYTFTTTVTETNEYQLLVTGTSTTATSAPVTLKVLPEAAPSVLANTSPGSASLFVGQQVTFTASFTGNQPITNQWQVSTNNGVTFSDIPGADTTTLALTDLQVTNSGEYRLEASNAFGSTNSTAATLIVQPVSAEPQPQIAGDVIVDLQSQDLSANNGTWPNRSVSPNTVGDFFSLSTTSSTLNVTNLIYNFQPIEVLAVDGVGGNAVQSTLDAPTEILGNSPFSAEAWIFATITDTTASDVLAYGLEGGAAAPADERAMGYVNEPYGAFTGDFGSSDTAWSPAPTTGVWHYLAWTEVVWVVLMAEIIHFKGISRLYGLRAEY